MKPFVFILASSLAVGIVAGVYVFFVTRTAEETVPQNLRERTGGFEIVADAYGGCQIIGCPSYRLLSDGSYVYVLDERDGVGERYEGNLSSEEIRALRTAMSTTDFEALKQRMFEGTCPAFIDGVSHRFTIRFEEETFEFDSCVEDIEKTSLFETLISTYSVFRSGETSVE
jgi:hypothetical protein